MIARNQRPARRPGLFLSLSHPSYRSSESYRVPLLMPKKNDKEPAKTHWRREARNIADSLAIAFILAMVIRHFVLEVFKIPTKSMQPTLLGDPFTGDKILVNKFAYDFRDPHRWEVMVFKYPVDTSRNYIKRVAGLPGETIRVFGGDLYVRTAHSDPQWQIARKPWNVQEALWRKRYTLSDSGQSYWAPSNPAAWTIRGDDFAVSADGSGDGEYLIYQREILAYEAREFEESHRPFVRIPTSDLMVQFHLIPEGPAEVEVALDCTTTFAYEEQTVHWTVRLPFGAGGPARPMLLRDGREVRPEESQPFTCTDGKPSLVQVCHVDQSLVVRVDGRQVLSHPYDSTQGVEDSHWSPEHRSAAKIGCRTGRALFRDPAIYVDVHYTTHPNENAVQAPFTLKDDEFFVLGDNSANSNDSRAWGVVPRRNLVGEAFLVLWPLGRMKLVR
jgi:signal peptidase I